jgi:hypothetical protein
MTHPEDAERDFELMKRLRDAGKFPPFLEAAARSYLCPFAGRSIPAPGKLSAQPVMLCPSRSPSPIKGAGHCILEFTELCS